MKVKKIEKNSAILLTYIIDAIGCERRSPAYLLKGEPWLKVGVNINHLLMNVKGKFKKYYK